MSEIVRDDNESRLLTIFEQGIIGFAKMSLTGSLIRVNDRFRVCFVWRDGAAWNVEIVDYH